MRYYEIINEIKSWAGNEKPDYDAVQDNINSFLEELKNCKKEPVGKVGDLDVVLYKNNKAYLYFGFLNEKPVFYCSLVNFKDGFQVQNIRSSHKGFAPIFYKYIVSKTGKPFYSDTAQTSSSKNLWNTLSKDNKFKIVAVDLKHNKEYPIRTGTNVIQSGFIKLYDKIGQYKNVILKLTKAGKNL